VPRGRGRSDHLNNLLAFLVAPPSISRAPCPTYSPCPSDDLYYFVNCIDPLKRSSSSSSSCFNVFDVAASIDDRTVQRRLAGAGARGADSDPPPLKLRARRRLEGPFAGGGSGWRDFVSEGLVRGGAWDGGGGRKENQFVTSTKPFFLQKEKEGRKNKKNTKERQRLKTPLFS